MKLLQVATFTGPKFVHVAIFTTQTLQVTTFTRSLYKLQLVQNLNLYITDILIQDVSDLNTKYTLWI